MAESTNNYRLYALNDGDVWYPGYDRRNMRTVDLQLEGLYSFVGPGVIDGWTVEAEPSVADRNALAGAPEGSYLAKEYARLGLPAVTDDDAWKQVVKVLPGKGIVGVHRAETVHAAYFRFQNPGVYYVWADAGACLVSEGRVHVAAPLDDDYDRDSRVLCTYLATVEVAEKPPSGSGVGYVSDILYEDKRNELKNLAGALKRALKKAFLNHVHSGAEGSPSKILLSTQLVLEAKGPIGSTILLTELGGKAFSWDPSDYGIPIVRFNDIPLFEGEYTLQPGAGRLMLKNSPPLGASVTVVLPLSPQVRLTMHPRSLISDSLTNAPPRNVPIYLTDGVSNSLGVGDDEGGLGGSEPRIYTWDPGVHRTPEVFLDGELVSPLLYTLLPERGAIDFNPRLTGSPGLAVLLTKIGSEIEGKLSGKRVADLDAASFTRGTLDANRIQGLSHLGLNRHKDKASVRPALRVFSGYGNVRYPESDSALQFFTDILGIWPTANIAGVTHLVGTKRGLASIDAGRLEASQWVESWNNDRGIVVHAVDDVLEAEPGANKFNTTYILVDLGPDKQKRVYFTRDGGGTWRPLRLPIIDGKTVDPTCFHATTNRVTSNKSLFLTTYDWFTNLYLGTREHGLWTAVVEEGATDEDWGWVQSDYASGRIDALQVVTTQYRSVTVSNGVSSISESYDRTVYLGTPGGLYVGSRRVSTFPVKGFRWIQGGGKLQNNLIWWNDDYLWITSTAEKVVEETAETTTTYWHHPLSRRKALQATARAATTEAINLDESTVSVDGVVLDDNDVVLVKNQADPLENGLWKVSTSQGWERHASDPSADDVFVDVAEGNTLAGSRWNVKFGGSSPYVGGEDPMLWTNYWWRPISDVGARFSDAVEILGTNDHYILGVGGSSRVRRLAATYPDLSSSTPNTPTHVALNWNVDRQGAARRGLVTSNPSGPDPQLVVASDRGLWRTLDDAVRWGRCREEFSQFANPRLFDERTGNRLSTSLYQLEHWSQSFVFGSSRPLWENLLYERDWTRYYVTPWNQNGADVIVYLNGQPSPIAYSIKPDAGLIEYSSSLLPDDKVEITIVRPGAFIADTGTVPHEEKPNVLLVGDEPLTTLAEDFKAGDTKLVLTERANIPLSASYLELRSGAFVERVAVVVDQQTREIHLTRPRSGDLLFPKTITEVRLVTMQTVLGVEDELSLAHSNQTYHLNSMLVSNVLRYALQRKSDDVDLFARWTGEPAEGTEADRGMKGVYFFDEPALIDEANSFAMATNQLLPSRFDVPTDPRSVTSLNVAPSGGRVGTDQGVWLTDGGKWRKESGLDGARFVYFVKDSLLGSDKGVYRRTGNAWASDPTFPQPTFAHLTFPWFAGQAEAWGKSDGLAFVWNPARSEGEQSDPPFQSDHFDLLRGKRVYGLYHDKFIRIVKDATGNSEQKPTDALYMATELGVYAVTNGSLNRSGRTSAFLGGREMFGRFRPTMEVDVPGASPEAPSSKKIVPVKFYRIFREPTRPVCSGESRSAVPIVLLSNNGVYKVRNWRWCDPDDANSLDFYPEVHALQGIPCYCHCTDARPCGPGLEPLAKIFVGTDRGVYRSFNGGSNWEPCERVGDDRLVVHDLKTIGEGRIVAATENGLYYTDDDGDSWYRPAADGNTTANYAYDISSAEAFEGGQSLAMVFQPKDSGTLLKDLRRVSLYLSVKVPEGHANPAACLTNTLSVAIYDVDPSTGKPTAPRNTSSVAPIAASSVAAPGFVTFDVEADLGELADNSRFAIVATETIAPGSLGTSVFRWHSSELSDPYSQGKGYRFASSNWSALEREKDLFFKAMFLAPPDPTTVVVDVDFDSGDGRGYLVDDEGRLTIRGAVAALVVVDDSSSAAWSEPARGDRKTKLPLLFTKLFERTDGGDFQPSFGAVWSFGTSLSDRTGGFTNNLERLVLRSSSLFDRGENSELCETARVAAPTLNPQSIVDAFFVSDEWHDKVQDLTTFLQSIGALRLDEVRSWFLSQPVTSRSLWPHDAVDAVAASAIKDYEDVASHLVERWAKSLSPLFVIAADGDGTGKESPQEVSDTAAYAWDDQGVGPVCLGLGASSDQATLRTIAAKGGRLAELVATSDWDIVTDSLLHGGANDLFEAQWRREFDFDTPTWVERVECEYTSPETSSCTVQVRWSANRINWSAWTTLESGVPASIDTALLALEYKVSIKEGWDGVEVHRPTVQRLQHFVALPGRRRVVTTAQDTSGALSEYLLTSIDASPKDARVEWYVIRGDSTDMNYAERLHVDRKGVLPDRQRSIQYTESIVRERLGTTTSDFVVFQVVDAAGQPTSWGETDEVQVYAGEFLVSPSGGYYSYDALLGKLYFGQEQPRGLPITVTLTTPPKLIRSFGEPTTTVDGRTFYLSGGPFPPDAKVVVVKNGRPMRGGYTASPENGTVALSRELDEGQVLTAYVEHSPVFRIVAEVYRYGQEDVDLSAFAVAVTNRRNLRLAERLRLAPRPQIVQYSLRIEPTNPTTDDHLSIAYDYVSADGAKERDTRTEWWRRRDDYVPSNGEIVDSDGFVKIDSYDNRTVVRQADRGSLFQQDDGLYVKVTPSDGFNLGAQVDSRPSISLRSARRPFITAAEIRGDGTTEVNGVLYCQSGIDLVASYTFSDPDGGIDSSTVDWFDRDSQSPIHTGSLLPKEQVTGGRVLSFVVTPYDGQDYGNPVRAREVTVR
jgi:hypothetical protein